MKISMKDIDKAFSGNKVLEHASLDIADGEIHSLMGENGAGKSTLMKILTGEYTRDNGTIFVDGQEVTYKNIQEAEKAGIVFIHQELNIVYDLTVTENLFLGKEIIGRFGVLDTKTMNEKAGEALARLGVDFDPRTLMRNLSVGQQQMVEICKAFMVNAKTIIMDEPTAALTQEESEVLFKVIRVLKSQGVSIIYISHRMEEIFELSDRVSVLRDGKTIGTCNIEDIDMNGIVKMMIGREIGDRYPERDTKIGDVVLEVDKLGRSGVFDDVSFKVHAGEVLGVSGLMGAGRTEIMQALFGYRPYDTGSVKIDGAEVTIHSPSQAMADGIGFATEDRKMEGLMLDDSIANNIALPNLAAISGRSGRIENDKEKKLVTDAIETLNIRCTGGREKCSNLSGGNQQKVVFAKWINTNPKILIMDEPTRGVDIGAKKEIYTVINELAGRGVAVIMVSSELPEILGMSDRIMVVHEGHVAGFLNKNEADQEKVMTLATGGQLNA